MKRIERNFIQIMEQVDYPAGVKSQHLVRCTIEQANTEIGRLYPDNPSWRTIEMREYFD